MFCMNCGKPLPDGSKFCPHCGTPVISSEGRGSSEEGPSLDDLLKKVEKKLQKILTYYSFPAGVPDFRLNRIRQTGSSPSML